MDVFTKKIFSKKAFTLVELIVVISVLAVLGTIASSQISNVTSSARDSQRLTDISSLKSAIDMYWANKGRLPIPTGGVEVTYSGWLLWTQGTFGDTTWRQIWSISPKPVDPKYQIEYAYSVASNGTEFELGGIVEKSSSFPNLFLQQTYAAAQNVTLIAGTYNGMVLKAVASSGVYVVSAPSLVSSFLGDAEIQNVGLTIDGKGSPPLGFSGVVVSMAQTGTFTPRVVWSGSTLPQNMAQVLEMMAGLQSSYSGSTVVSRPAVSNLLAATGSARESLGVSIVTEILGGDLIEVSSGSKSGEEEASTGCQTGFIEVPGNEAFNTTDFCVMKYEAKVALGTAGPSANGVTYNTHDYVAGQTPVSTALDIPIGKINQSQAITACTSLGAGYHLITNNEWMTIARNIEGVASNWSTGIVGNGYIYSGHTRRESTGPDAALVASADDAQGYTWTTRTTGAYRRTHTLSNGNVIWDISGNMGEHVNKANTLDGSGYSGTTVGLADACGSPTGYYSFTGSDWAEPCTYQNSYTYANIGPGLAGLNVSNGVGRIYSSTTATANVYLRWGFWRTSYSAGIYALNLETLSTSAATETGFRCVKLK